MIRFTLSQRPDGTLTAYTLRGHADYAAEGDDIVCAAASALSITCLNSLEAVCHIQPRVSGGKDGLLQVQLPPSLDADRLHDAQVLLKALHQGMKDLAEAYPRHVHVSTTIRRETP